jgi:hypothetical protein
MKPRPRIRKTIKWGGLALGLLLAGVWVRSEFATEAYITSRLEAGWDQGCVWMLPGPEVNRFRGYVRLANFGPRKRYWRPLISFHSPSWWVIIPLWLPLAPTLLATAAAWRLDALARRRARAGVCPKCDYDRAGLASSAVCPECGMPSSGPEGR